MKKFLIMFFLGLTALKCVSQSNINGYQVTGTNAQQYSLGNYKGQKIMVVILPTKQTSTDSTFMARLDSIALSNKGALKTFAVPSYEDGYSSVSAAVNPLMKWYQTTLDSSIIISQPLYTHIASGVKQDKLFAWLTHSSLNTQFDYEITGTRTMFFLNGQGNLYGIIEPGGEFSNKALNRMMQ